MKEFLKGLSLIILYFITFIICSKISSFEAVVFLALAVILKELVFKNK